MWLLGDHGRLIKWHPLINFPFIEQLNTLKEHSPGCSFSYISESQVLFYVVRDVSPMAIRLENGLKKVVLRDIMDL